MRQAPENTSPAKWSSPELNQRAILWKKSYGRAQFGGNVDDTWRLPDIISKMDLAK
jgi:hypothetical protein